MKKRLYVIGPGSKVYCLNADSGCPIWKAKLSWPSNALIASSIAVDDKVEVLLADVLTGLDAETGKVLWTQEKITGQESSPVQWNTKGRVYVVCNGAQETHGVDPADGRILRSVPGGGNSTPVVVQEYGGDFFLLSMSDNRKNGLSAYRLTDRGPEKLSLVTICDPFLNIDRLRQKE